MIEVRIEYPVINLYEPAIKALHFITNSDKSAMAAKGPF
jgi:hypothetical protein